MPTPTTVRRIIPSQKRNFGRISRRVSGSRPDPDPDPQLRAIPPGRHLPADKRTDAGLEGVFREIFPIESYDKTLKLEYLHYDLGKPRYDPDECRQLRLTYGRPLHVWLRLNKGETDARRIGLPGRHADHDRRRRVHHQRRRARRRQPAPPLARRRFRRRDRVGRQEAARLPRHPRARQLDRAPRHQEGHAGRPDRPVGQVLGDDPAPRHEPAVLDRRGDPPGVLRGRGRSTRPIPRRRPSSRAGSPAATSSTRPPARS